MVNQWYYNRSGQQQGPFSDSELRKLANEGDLGTDDLIWKEGMAEWRKADSLKGLFQKAIRSTPPPLPTKPKTPTESEPVPPLSEKKSGVSFGESAKLAAQLTAKQTELTKIKQVSLPNQYVIIGTQAFEGGTQRQANEPLFNEIERLNHAVSEFEKSGEHAPEATTFADKAMALGGKAVTTTKLKAAQLQRRQKFVQLGKSISEGGYIPSACQPQKAEIDVLLDRARTLQSEIADIKGTLTEYGREGAASGRSFLASTAVVGSLAVLCAPIGLFLIWRHPTWSKDTKKKWAGVSIACFLMFVVVGEMQEAATLRELAAANQLWDEGNNVDAIDEYRNLISKPSVPSSEMPRLYRRVIEFDCENDNIESAKSLIEGAHRRGIKLTLTNSIAKSLLTDFESKEDQENTVEQRRSRSEPSPADDSRDGPGTASESESHSVSLGFLKGSFSVENQAADEIQISQLSYSDWRLDFKVKWHGSIVAHRPDPARRPLGYRDPWHWSAYDGDGTKLDGGAVMIPNSVDLDSTFKSHITFQRDSIKDAGLSRVVIHY